MTLPQDLILHRQWKNHIVLRLRNKSKLLHACPKSSSKETSRANCKQSLQCLIAFFVFFRIPPNCQPFQSIALKRQKIPINPAPLTQSHTNCAYFGLATNTSTAPIPRIMIAVLKLLAPTSPTIGKIRSMTNSKYRICFIFRTFFVITHAKNKITAIFANSEG